MVTPLLISVGVWIVLSIVTGLVLGRSISLADRRNHVTPPHPPTHDVPTPRI